MWMWNNFCVMIHFVCQQTICWYICLLPVSGCVVGPPVILRLNFTRTSFSGSLNMWTVIVKGCTHCNHLENDTIPSYYPRVSNVFLSYWLSYDAGFSRSYEQMFELHLNCWRRKIKKIIYKKKDNQKHKKDSFELQCKEKVPLKDSDRYSVSCTIVLFHYFIGFSLLSVCLSSCPSHLCMLACLGKLHTYSLEIVLLEHSFCCVNCRSRLTHRDHFPDICLSVTLVLTCLSGLHTRFLGTLLS